ncbi:MAG: hypothetical protein WCF57_08680 [Pyrinomonadaceae bacterium]
MSKTKHIGQCIYCRALPTPEDPLSDEHIIPLGLYGTQMLGKASCKSCAAITSDFEGKVQQHDMGDLRHSLNFPSRRKNKRKNIKLPMEVITRGGEVKNIEVSPEDYYPIIALPVFRPPAYISKEKYDGGIEMIGYVTVPPKRSLEKIVGELDAKEVAIYSLRWPKAWARMFAKIAYALAVREYGLDRLNREDIYVLSSILGKTNDVGMWVGCVEEQVFSGDQYKEQLAGLWLKDGEIHVVIKLFSWLNIVPEYHVVVGKLSS